MLISISLKINKAHFKSQLTLLVYKHITHIKNTEITCYQNAEFVLVAAKSE